MTGMPVEKPKSLKPVALLVGTLGSILAIATVLAVNLWAGTGDVAMSVHGYIAMAVGAVATLALGGGLMALVFFSSRHGYDDAASGGRDD